MASPAKLSSPARSPGPSAPKPEEDAAPAAEDPRALLRRRWELASVLHFLQVFEPVIEADLGLSADEIETALIDNNRDLARVHIALLKGIPPVNKNFNVDDGWVIATAKKLADWWSWVAEGTNPFIKNPGKEVETFKELDPLNRLFVLKALCDVRSEQNDAVRYVNDELKKGGNISNFRKEKLGSANDGATYWYIGDSTVGHRLFKEDVTVDFKNNWKGKNGRLTKPVLNIQWETIATNLDEFLDISEKLCSKGRSGSAIGEHLKNNTIPAVEKFEKKKQRILKLRQQKEERLAFANYQTRALRERKPVSYNYSDYDRSIEEAIKAAAKAKEADPPKEAGKKRRHVPHEGDNGANVGSDISLEHKEDREQEDAKDLDDLSSEDDEVSDYNDDKDDGSSSSDGDTDASDSHESNSEEEDVVTRKRTRLAARKVDSKPRQGLRRSRRNMKSDDEEMVEPGQVTPEAMTKKTTRQRPTPISKQFAMSGSEDEDSGTVADSESGSEDDAVADSESGSEDDAVADSGSGSEDDTVADSGSGSEGDHSEPDADSRKESGSP